MSMWNQISLLAFWIDIPNLIVNYLSVHLSDISVTSKKIKLAIKID